MSNVIQQFNARMQYIGMTKQQLANAVQKTLETVKKQFSEGRSNMTLATMEEYANALGGEICFITGEIKEILEDANASGLRERIVALGEENQKLKEQVDILIRTMAERDEMLKHERQRIEHKDEIIEQKDERIRLLLEKVIK